MLKLISALVVALALNACSELDSAAGQAAEKSRDTALSANSSPATHTHNQHAVQGPIKNSRELTKDEKTIQAVLDAYGRAMEERSVTLMERAVIPGDFTTIESGYPNWSWEDFRDNHLAVEMGQFSDVDYDIDLIIGEFQGSLGFAVYRYTASGTLKEKTVGVSGLGTAILERGAAGWRIHHLHTSAPREQLEGMSGG